jgi:hypothetical protein
VVDDIVADPSGPPWVEPSPGEPLAFRSVGQKTPISFAPLYAIHGERYAVYLKVRPA